MKASIVKSINWAVVGLINCEFYSKGKDAIQHKILNDNGWAWHFQIDKNISQKIKNERRK